MNILLSLDGVLSSETGEPIRAGVALYYALNASNRVAIMTSRTKEDAELFVDADPSLCAWVFEEQKVPTILMSHPSYAKVENRPDAPSKVRKWADIEEAVTRVNIARTLDYKKPDVELGEYGD